MASEKEMERKGKNRVTKTRLGREGKETQNERAEPRQDRANRADEEARVGVGLRAGAATRGRGEGSAVRGKTYGLT